MIQASQTDADIDAGLAHHEAGRIAEAEALYRRALAADPDHADALNLLGVILQDAGDLHQSIATLSRAVTVDPGFAEAFVNLARAQNAVGDPAAAKRSSQHAIDLDPELAEAHLQSAQALITLMDNDAAAAAARHAIVLQPASVDAHLFLGHALRALNDYPAAERIYRTADRLAPDRYETLLNLGMVLAELKQVHNAIPYCRRAVELQPENAAAHAALGVALRRDEDISGSVEAFGLALALTPDDPVVWRQQGDNFSLLGQFDAAADCYHRVLALDPNSSEALSCLAAINKLADSESEQARLQTVLDDPDRPEIERLTAGFALGRMFDTAADYDAAIAAYTAANRLAQAASLTGKAGFDRAEFRGWIEKLRAAFGPPAFAATAGWGNSSEVPVFIVGMPRTGSSLIEQILASHPDVYGAGERKDIPAISLRLEADRSALDPATWDPALVRREAAALCAQWRSMGGSSIRVIDKLLDNITLLGHIAVLFPNARVIFARRDLRDVCLSCYFQSFRDGVDWSFDLADCAERACEIERLTAHWRNVLPLRMLEVEYEKLVGDLEGESRRLIDFIGLDWNDACLRFHDTQRFVQTASFWQVRQPLYDSSVGRWRHYQRHLGVLFGGLAGVVPLDDVEVSVSNILVGASAHLQARRNDAADTAYHLVVEREPDNAEALHALGRLARERGDLLQAVTLLSRALAIRPGEPSVLAELSLTYRIKADLQASAETARQAVALDPANASAQFLLGSALLDLNDVAGARTALEQAVRLAPHSRDAQLYFAMVCMRLKDHETAVTALREADRLRPDDAESLAKLGRILGEIGRHDEALPLLHRAVQLAPGDGRVHLALVAVLWLTHDVGATTTANDRALRVAPELADLWLHDGFCKAALGRFVEAEVSFRKALTIDPQLDAARFELAGIGVRDDAELDVTRLHGILVDPRREAIERIGAGHVLGELHDRAGDYDAAWDAYEAANRLAFASHQAAGRLFDPSTFDTRIAKLIAAFPRDVFLTASDLGDQSDLPVFVVGLPRSGTTLVEQIASSHPAVFGAGELDDIRAAASRLDTEPSPFAAEPTAREAALYLNKLRDLGGDAKRVIDKMPDNFQWLGHIAILFPKARIVFCHRDYRDVALSCHFQHFGDNLPWTVDLLAMSARMHGFDRLMAHWLSVLPLSVLEVQYEDLVHNPESQSRRLIDFLGLDWDPACLAFHKTERTVITASQWQVRQPLFTTSIARWRNYQPHLNTLLAGLAGLVAFDGDKDWDSLAVDPAAALAIAVSHHRAKRLDFAEAIYRALLRRDPLDPVALHLLGVLQCHLGEPAEAVALISRSLALRPDVALVLVDLARAFCAAGDGAKAAEAANRALTLDPALPDALVQLGCALRLQLDPAAAIEVLQRALEMKPDSLEAWVAFASALTDRRDHNAAARAWQTTLELQPNDLRLLQEHARSLMEIKQFDKALALFRQVDAAAPGQPNVQYGIAGALMNTGDIAMAADMCRQALETTPDARFWLLLANAEATLGHFEVAAEAYRTALAFDPTLTGALHDLTALGVRIDDAATIKAARQVLADEARTVRDRVAAGFTVGRVCDRHDAYDEAFAAFALANQMLREDRNAHGTVFDRDKFCDLVTRQIAAVTPPAFAATAGWGNPSEVPVFVVGMPRSGTSLVEQIAASHKRVFGAGERMEVFGILSALEEGKVDRPPAEWDRAAVRREATAYVRQLQEMGGRAIRVIDKQPDNILALGQIAVLFPRARVVVCRRDLRDVGLSCHFQYFRDDPLVWTNDLADFGFRARQIERLLDHWRAVLPIPVLEVQYERLVANLEAESRRLIDFLGLEWDPACLSFHETDRAVMTASHWQVRQPLYSSSAGRWRHYRRHLGPLLRGLEGMVPAAEGVR